MTDPAFTYTAGTELLPRLRALFADGDLLPCWNGPRRWQLRDRINLANSIERRWPIGHVVIWDPTGRRTGPLYLLDGHQRLEAPDPGYDPPEALLRDLTVDHPAYLTASAATTGGSYLAVDAIWHTIPFLHTVRTLTDDAVRRAENVAHSFRTTQVVTYRLYGGSTADIHAICGDLVRGTVPRALIDSIAAHARDGAEHQRRP